MDIRYEADTSIAHSKRGYDTQSAVFNAEINRSKAEAELAYELQVSLIQR